MFKDRFLFSWAGGRNPMGEYSKGKARPNRTLAKRAE